MVGVGRDSPLGPPPISGFSCVTEPSGVVSCPLTARVNIHRGDLAVISDKLAKCGGINVSAGAPADGGGGVGSFFKDDWERMVFLEDPRMIFADMRLHAATSTPTGTHPGYLHHRAHHHHHHRKYRPQNNNDCTNDYLSFSLAFCFVPSGLFFECGVRGSFWATRDVRNLEYFCALFRVD